MFLVLFVHHHEHDVLFLMKISITYQKKKKKIGPNMALKKFRVSVKVKRRERIGGDKCFVVSMNKQLPFCFVVYNYNPLLLFS